MLEACLMELESKNSEDRAAACVLLATIAGLRPQTPESITGMKNWQIMKLNINIKLITTKSITFPWISILNRSLFKISNKYIRNYNDHIMTIDDLREEIYSLSVEIILR